MHITVPQSAFMRDEIAHRGALQEIAIVKKQGVGRLGAGLFDQVRGADQSDPVPWPVGVVIIGQKMQVQIRRFQHPKVHGALPYGQAAKGTGIKQRFASNVHGYCPTAAGR